MTEWRQKEAVEAESHSAADEVQLSQAGTTRVPKLPRKQLRGKMGAREGSSEQGRGTRSPYLKSFKMPPHGKLLSHEARIEDLGGREDIFKKLPKYCSWATYIPLDCLQNKMMMMNPSRIMLGSYCLGCYTQY